MRPLWTCPSCGNRFVTANIWHSCTSIGLDEAFAGTSAEVRAAFDAFPDLTELLCESYRELGMQDALARRRASAPGQ